VNRQELERRIHVLESQVQFVMHTLQMTRRNESTGVTDSRTLDQLFQEAATHAMDGKSLAQVAAGSFARPAPLGPGNPPVTSPDGHTGDPDESPTPLSAPADAKPTG
jgi:hypothetical protein